MKAVIQRVSEASVEVDMPEEELDVEENAEE